MSGQISFNPGVTTNAAGSFNVQSLGYIQGCALADPAARFALSGGVLSLSETLPMWGGVGISESIVAQPSLPGGALGSGIKRAPSLTGANALTGFSVFDQNHSAINTPQSPVPLVAVGMTMNFYRLGSGIRIPVAMDPALADLEGDIVTSQVSWDFGAQRLIPYVAAYPANVITAASWAAGVVTLTTTSAHGVAVGDDFTISGMVPDAYNGNFTAVAGTTGSTLKYALTADPGAETTLGTLVAGGGALNVRVLDLQVGNSMTVSYDPTTGFATWNRQGSTAIILL